MNVLFLTVIPVSDIRERGIYTDLMRCFEKNGHQLYVISPVERRFNEAGSYRKEGAVHYIRVKTLNIQKTNLLEKGIATLLFENLFLRSIRQYCKEVRFDLVLYTTPPITFSRIVTYIKKRDKAICYLLLKDIFPQNAIDLGMIGEKGFIHRYFRQKEKKLYKVSDFIGCMSPANQEYILKHNPELDNGKVEVNPNSIEPLNYKVDGEKFAAIRQRFKIPPGKALFVYGGNIGKPQGINFLLNVLQSNKKNDAVFFLIIGSGTEFLKMKTWFTNNKPTNAVLLDGLPKNDYDELLATCDVGMIFLDKRFTIPNYPSRLLSYLEFKIPVLAATDKNTDIGKVLTENEFGYWAESGDLESFNEAINKLLFSKQNRVIMGVKGNQYLNEHYHVNQSYSIIMNHFKHV
jgi:glycosyltransferase involved in cell wall biosynthesis